MITDKYISIAFFEVIHNAVIGAAAWDYLYRLLRALVDKPNDRLHRSVILQELVNVCHCEYSQVQKLFKRYVQALSGSKYFARVPGVFDNGTARVTMKTKPERLTAVDPQTHYLLRLCQVETDVSGAVFWVKKLGDLPRADPSEREKMEESEFDAFGDLAVTTDFFQSLSASLPLPPTNSKKGQMYVSRLKALESEVDTLKKEVDLSRFAIPIDNLLEPGMAEGALTTLDHFIVDKAGSELGFLYEELTEECLAEIQKQYNQQKVKIEKKDAKTDHPPPPPPVVEAPPSLAVRVEQLKQKQKTRPPHSSIYNINPTKATPAQSKPTETSPVFRVKPRTFDVFSTLFSRPKSSRGSIGWPAFETAMRNLMFSVLPWFGSVYMFSPPRDFGIPRSITVHRPHQSRIEGYRLLFIASRLKRVYG